VLNVDLLTMGEAKLFMGGCVTGLVPAHDIRFQSDYNQNGINLWFSGVHPGMKMVDGKLVLDFTILDEWMVAAAKRGLAGNVWFLGGNPYGYPITMTIFREMAKIDNRNGAKPMTTEEWVKLQCDPANRDRPMKRQRELVVEWCRQVTTHAKAKGWPEVILTPFDEPAKWIQSRADPHYRGAIGTGEWIKPYFKDACAAIREGAPGTRIYGSIHHINYRGRNSGLRFLPDIDVFCTNAIHEDSKIGDKVRAAGKDFWQYSGVGSGGAGSPDRARFTFGFFFAAFDSRGSLAWAYNWGRGFDTTSGSNWMYAWQTPYDTIPAPYFEGLREAWDDRRVIETYRKRFAGDAEAMAELKAILSAAARSRSRGGRDTVSDFWAAADDASKMDRWRDQLLARPAGQRVICGHGHRLFRRRNEDVNANDPLDRLHRRRRPVGRRRPGRPQAAPAPDRRRRAQRLLPDHQGRCRQGPRLLQPEGHRRVGHPRLQDQRREGHRHLQLRPAGVLPPQLPRREGGHRGPEAVQRLRLEPLRRPARRLFQPVGGGRVEAPLRRCTTSTRS